MSGSEKSSEKSLALIDKTPYITISALSKKLKLSTRAIEKQLAILKAEGILERVGSAKNGFWKNIRRNK